MTPFSRWAGPQAGANAALTDHCRTPGSWRCRETEWLWIPSVIDDLSLPTPHLLLAGEEAGISLCVRTIDALLPTITFAAVPVALARATRQRWLAFNACRLAALWGEPLRTARGVLRERAWTDGFRRSITHAGRLATVLAPHTRSGRLVGIDSEIAGSPAGAAEIMPLVTTAIESMLGACRTLTPCPNAIWTRQSVHPLKVDCRHEPLHHR